jgi:arginyl-tRNA synthetase
MFAALRDYKSDAHRRLEFACTACNMPPAADSFTESAAAVAINMKTIVSQLDHAFRSAIAAAFDIHADPLIGPSQNERFGDYQSNAAMGLAKTLAERTGEKTNPRQVAEQIKAKLDLGELASEISIAGPGFINVRLSSGWLSRQLESLLQQAGTPERLGIDPASDPVRTVIDYSSPNVAKQMHVGHLRSTNLGDALARVLEFQGHDVIRQNHIGDWGTQFGMLLHYLKETGGGGAAHIADLDAFYKAAKARFDDDPRFAEAARQAVVNLQSGGEEELRLWRTIIDESRRHFERVYARMNVQLVREHERGESYYNPMLADVVKELREKGVAVESEGAIVVWVDGFEAPLIIQKSGGGFGYGTTDLAALGYRIRELGAKRIIYLTDSRQSQHFRQFFDAARRAGWTESVRLDHIMFGTILGPDNKPFKARSGESVKLMDLLEEAEQRALVIVEQKNPELPEEQKRRVARAVGIGAIKYFDLARDPIGNYVFDWDKMLAMEGNTAPYLQYAYARIRSIFRRGQERGITITAAGIQLDSPHEIALGKHILRLGEIVAIVGRELKPHHLCNYLYELATRFSGFFENCPVLQSEDPIRSSRLQLCETTARTLAMGLELLGIEHPEQM